MVRQPGFCDVEERLRELSAKGDDLDRIPCWWISAWPAPSWSRPRGRGSGEPLDRDGPNPPVIEASIEHAARETVGALLD